MSHSIEVEWMQWPNDDSRLRRIISNQININSLRNSPWHSIYCSYFQNYGKFSPLSMVIALGYLRNSTNDSNNMQHCPKLYIHRYFYIHTYFIFDLKMKHMSHFACMPSTTNLSLSTRLENRKKYRETEKSKEAKKMRRKEEKTNYNLRTSLVYSYLMFFPTCTHGCRRRNERL